MQDKVVTFPTPEPSPTELLRRIDELTRRLELVERAVAPAPVAIVPAPPVAAAPEPTGLTFAAELAARGAHVLEAPAPTALDEVYADLAARVHAGGELSRRFLQRVAKVIKDERPYKLDLREGEDPRHLVDLIRELGKLDFIGCRYDRPARKVHIDRRVEPKAHFKRFVDGAWLEYAVEGLVRPLADACGGTVVRGARVRMPSGMEVELDVAVAAPGVLVVLECKSGARFADRLARLGRAMAALDGTVLVVRPELEPREAARLTAVHELPFTGVAEVPDAVGALLPAPAPAPEPQPAPAEVTEPGDLRRLLRKGSRHLARPQLDAAAQAVLDVLDIEDEPTFGDLRIAVCERTGTARKLAERLLYDLHNAQVLHLGPSERIAAAPVLGVRAEDAAALVEASLQATTTWVLRQRPDVTAEDVRAALGAA